MPMLHPGVSLALADRAKRLACATCWRSRRRSVSFPPHVAHQKDQPANREHHHSRKTGVQREARNGQAEIRQVLREFRRAGDAGLVDRRALAVTR